MVNVKYRIEEDVTNGLGYERIPHYDDTEIGLVRHLANMELRVVCSTIRNASDVLFSTIFSYGPLMDSLEKEELFKRD